MKTKNYEDFKISLNLNIEVDASLRRITEKIKIIAQRHDPSLMDAVVTYLRDADSSIDSVITNCICNDECTED